MNGRITAVFLVALYLTAMLRPAAPALGFALNRDFIAQVLCINQDRPEMKCNGSCHLKKMVEETEKQDSQGIPSLIRITDYPVSLLYASKNPRFIPEKLKFTFPINCGQASEGWPGEIFHPPA